LNDVDLHCRSAGHFRQPARHYHKGGPVKYFSRCRVFKLWWLAMFIAGVAGTAHSEAPPAANRNMPEAVAPPWELYDTDEDGYISAEEAAAQGMPALTFKGLDVDRDGRLNKDEFAKAPRIKLK
jgi:hypothetical protein